MSQSSGLGFSSICCVTGTKPCTCARAVATASHEMSESFLSIFNSDSNRARGFLRAVQILDQQRFVPFFVVKQLVHESACQQDSEAARPHPKLVPVFGMFGRR